MHHFRHSRATLNASFLTEVQMCLFFGWAIGSRQVRTYVHASGKETDSAVLQMYGLSKKEDSKPKDSPINCPVCEHINESIASFCSKCGNVLTIAKAIKVQEKTNEAVDSALKFLELLAKNPELMEKFEEFKTNINPKSLPRD